jgi:hypothetical protein
MRRSFAVGATAISHTLFVLALAVVGLLIGALLGFGRVDKLPLEEPWEQVGSPPARVTALLMIDRGDLYVTAADDQVYRCCWERSELPDYPSGPGSHFPCDVSQEKPSPPAGVINRLDITYCGPDYGLAYAYVLLDDGSVWRWSHAQDGLATMGALLTYSLGGIGGGFVLGGTIAIWSWRRRSRKWKQPPHGAEVGPGS